MADSKEAVELYRFRIVLGDRMRSDSHKLDRLLERKIAWKEGIMREMLGLYRMPHLGIV
jgi:hypothetical protein